MIKNENGIELLGDVHTPAGPARACVILLHGFKGYKDYGFIPVLAHDLCEQGCLVHRFNSSTSGMTNEIQTFARPDLFEQDTWTSQVVDLVRVIEAIRSGELQGNGLPIYIVGHSRGGATALLTAGRHGKELDLHGVVTINAIDRCNKMSEHEQQQIIERGYIITESARTKQSLKISSRWLSEQLEDPEAHNVLGQAEKIECPVCVIHGDDDQAVDSSAGRAIANTCDTELVLLKNGNHVLNMSNPSMLDSERSTQLLETTAAITRLITKQECSDGS